MVVHIDGDALTGLATGRKYDTEAALQHLTAQEKIECAYLIKMLRADPQLLREAGDPLLLARYGLIHNLLSTGRDPGELLAKFLPSDEFAIFKGRFLEDEKFRVAFDDAYYSHRLTAIRGEACTKGAERVTSELDVIHHRVRSWLGFESRTSKNRI